MARGHRLTVASAPTPVAKWNGRAPIGVIKRTRHPGQYPSFWTGEQSG